jgi:PAS domain S-box-containing protein
MNTYLRKIHKNRLRDEAKDAAANGILASEETYQNLVKTLPVAVYACDQNGYIQLYNAAATELWGREPVIGEDRWCASSKLYTGDNQLLQFDQSPLALTLKTGKPESGVEIIMERPNGSRRYVLSHPQPVFDKKGHLKGAFNTLIDITGLSAELKDAQLKLHSEYSRGLIEASLDPWITINIQGEIMDVNQAMVDATAFPREKLKNTAFEDYFTDPVQARKVYQEVFSKGFVANYPLTIKDHNSTDVLFNGSVFKNEKGEVAGAVVVARDITDQKRIENELIEAKIFAEMATIIAEESKSKAENATQVAEEATIAKQQFLANMSHEIRTPMNAIIGFTKVMLKTELSAKQKEYLTAIKTSGDALIVLINDILDLAKVDAGKMVFEHTPFKMVSAISSMLHLFDLKVQEKNVTLSRHIDPKIPKVLLGDPTRLHQIILNLVSNAVKFTEKGAIGVNIRLLKEDATLVSLEFSVSDTGIGIPETQLESIFQNFQQASGGTSRLFGGTGLGLAIAKKLVEQQGGSIHVKSKVGLGSTFSFILDFQKTNAEVQLDALFTEFDNEIRNVKVLVVEDMILNQLLMKTVLDDFGFEWEVVSNGKIAVEKMESNAYDIILMDLQMPEMNGFEATDFIRKRLKSKIPIIALTADVTTVDLEKCKAAGMDDYIAKPVDEKLLYNKIIGLVLKPNHAISSENDQDMQSSKVRYTDLDFLIQRTKNNSTMLMEMISAYLDQTPPLVSAMKQSLENHDWDTLHASVHKMIPSFSIMGIDTAYEKMARTVLEYTRSKQQKEEISELVMNLEMVCIQACKELETELNQIKKQTHES